MLKCHHTQSVRKNYVNKLLFGHNKILEKECSYNDKDIRSTVSIMQPSKFTSAVGNWREFCRGKQCYNSNHLGKNIAEVIIPSKYIQFTIFNTYFSTKCLFTDKRYHLHVLEKCLYVLQKVRSIIYFPQFIYPLSLRLRGNGTSFAFTSYIILSA